MRGGFDIGRARDRPLAGAMPVCDCLLAEAGLREVMGEQLRLRLGNVGKAGFQLRGDVRMKLLPAAAQQAGIGRIAHQRVLEQVGGLRWCPALKHKTGCRPGGRGRRPIRPRCARRPAPAAHTRSRGRLRRRSARLRAPSGRACRAAPSTRRAMPPAPRPPPARSLTTRARRLRGCPAPRSRRAPVPPRTAARRRHGQ